MQSKAYHLTGDQYKGPGSFGGLVQMDYDSILSRLEEKGEDEADRYKAYCANHPRKEKTKTDGSRFWFSLANQLRKWTEGDKKFPTPFTEKQARFVDKAAPGAYSFIMNEARNCGQWMNHQGNCPVRLGLNNKLGLVIDEKGIITCEGCNALLGKLQDEPELPTIRVNLSDIELPDTIDLDLEAVELF